MDYKEEIYKTYFIQDEDIEKIDKSNFYRRSNYYNDIIKKFMPENKNIRILDIGCGHGEFVECLNLQGYLEVKGIDISEQQVKIAKMLNRNGVVKADVRTILEFEKYDMIICFDLLEHLTKNEFYELTTEIFKSLNDGGTFIFHVPNGESPYFGRVFYGDFTHELCFTSYSLVQIMKTIGFKKVNISEETPVVHGIVSFIRSFLWRIIRVKRRIGIAIESGYWNSDICLSQNILGVVKK